MKGNFEDYSRENSLFKKEINCNLDRIMQLKDEGEYERYIKDFEDKFAEYNGSKYVLGVNSGTTALQLALRASGIKENDEVILPVYTYIATALAVSNIGARPVFVDIKEDTLTIDTSKVRKSIKEKTKAIILVHIHGNPCGMEELINISKEQDLIVVEDASHAHGAEYKGTKIGNFGIGCFSNYSNKVFSGIGSSGLITTNDTKTYKTLKAMIKVGDDPEPTISKRTPCRMSIMQAAVLKAKLPYLDRLVEIRRKSALLYRKKLPSRVKFQREEDESRHVYRDIVIMAEDRERWIKYLSKMKVHTKIRYSVPLHLSKYYKYLGYKKGDFPIAEKVCARALCLSSFYKQ